MARCLVNGIESGDLTMHRARRYEDERYKRDLRRTTLTDGVPTVDQQVGVVGF